MDFKPGLDELTKREEREKREPRTSACNDLLPRVTATLQHSQYLQQAQPPDAKMFSVT
jgi:hypothetical protein